MERVLNQILDELKSLNQRVEKIEKSVGNIESTQQEHTQLLRVLEHRTDVISAKVIAMDETIQRSEGRITSMERSTLAIKSKPQRNHRKTRTLDSSVVYLANKFTQHDMQLFEMKRRAK